MIAYKTNLHGHIVLNLAMFHQAVPHHQIISLECSSNQSVQFVHPILFFLPCYQDPLLLEIYDITSSQR